MKAITLAALALCLPQTLHAVSLITLVGNAPGSQFLNSFDSSTPGASNLVSVTGLNAGETLLGIDFRPASNGQLFGLGSGSRLYTINTSTGVASVVGGGLNPGLITATSYGFDFNPTIDRIRIVSTDDSNTVGHPGTGATAVIGTNVAFGAGDPNVGVNPNLVHHAYNNNFVPTSTSQLYALDSNLNILVTQANNAGTLGSVGALGVDFGEEGGFDISANNVAFAALFAGGGSGLYTIDLATGSATSLGGLFGDVYGLAVVPEPSSALLIGCSALALLRRKRIA